MKRYVATVFLGALLLFLVQPLAARFLLPWFGGTPSVWTTCMLFFQLLLLGGYAYVHFMSRQVPAAWQGYVHAAFLAGALVLLPLDFLAAGRPTGDENPVSELLLLLIRTVGGPFLVLSATAPLLQNWAARSLAGSSAYRLYAVSNAGSLLALLGYPFVVEPCLTRSAQTHVWSGLFVAFAALAAWCGISAARSRSIPLDEPPPSRPAPALTRRDKKRARAAGEKSPSPLPGPRLSPWVEFALWLGLSACGCVLLLAVTNQLCQDVSVVSLLWVLPLAVYLLSFILCFESDRWYAPQPWAIAFVGSMVVVGLIACELSRSPGWIPVTLKYLAQSVPVQVAGYMALLLSGTMLCHGELAKLRPSPDRLTAFYLTLASGGALGGLLVGVAAPLLFANYWEFPLALAATGLLTLAAWISRQPSARLTARRSILLAGSLLLLCAAVAYASLGDAKHTVVTVRSFFGVSRVADNDPDQPWHNRTLKHGRTQHGLQFQGPDTRHWPTAYFGRSTGAGILLDHHPRRSAGQPLSIGIIGLGAGTLAAYGRPGDKITFYEIDSAVLRLAQEYFTFLSDSEAEIHYVLGDARVSLEREAAQGRAGDLDVLIVDAFSSDAVPTHLLTEECGQVYRARLAPGGVLAMHLSNRHVDLLRVARGLAAELQMQAILVSSADDPGAGVLAADWVLFANDTQFLGDPVVKKAQTAWDDSQPPVVWTDDYSSLWQVLR